MDAEQRAARIIEALIADGLVDPGSRGPAEAAARGALEDAGAPAGPVGAGGLPTLIEVVAYLGGALVLAAGGLFLVQTWSDLGDGGRLTALVFVTAVLGIAGLVARGAAPLAASRRRLGGTLLTAAACAAGFSVGLAVDLGDDPEWGELDLSTFAATVTVAVAAAAGYGLARTPVGQLGILGGVIATVTQIVDAAHESHYGLWVGLALLGIGAGWLAFAEAGAFAEQITARALGSALAFFGAQLTWIADDQSTLAYVLTAGVAVAGVALYLTRGGWPYLAAAVLGVTLVVPEAVNDWTDGSLGAVGGVLIAGVALLAASFGGYQMRARAERREGAAR